MKGVLVTVGEEDQFWHPTPLRVNRNTYSLELANIAIIIEVVAMQGNNAIVVEKNHIYC